MAKRVPRQRSHRVTSEPREESVPRRRHHKGEKHRHHHRKSEREAEENLLGDFAKAEEKEAISASESEDNLPSYTFAAPITRLSRSPTPMGRRPIVVAPGRKFVPQKTVEAISSSDDEDPVFLGRTSILGTRSFASPTRPSMSASRLNPSGPTRTSGFGASAFGANRSSQFTRNNMAPRSRNPVLVDSDSEDDTPMRRTSFAPRTSMTGRPSMGRFVKDDDENDRRKTTMGLERFRSM